MRVGIIERTKLSIKSTVRRWIIWRDMCAIGDTKHVDQNARKERKLRESASIKHLDTERSIKTWNKTKHTVKYNHISDKQPWKNTYRFNLYLVMHCKLLWECKESQPNGNTSCSEKFKRSLCCHWAFLSVRWMLVW